MHPVAIAVYASHDSPHLTETLSCLSSTVAASVQRQVYDYSRAARPTALSECLQQLVRECPAEIYLLLESGCLPAPLWLEDILSVFHRVPRCGLVGPSTNRGSGPQAVFAQLGTDCVRNAAAAKLRFGTAYRSLSRNLYLDDFCIAIRRSLLDLRLPRPDSSAWIQELSGIAARASFSALWSCGAYVHRLPSPASFLASPNSPARVPQTLPAPTPATHVLLPVLAEPEVSEPVAQFCPTEPSRPSFLIEDPSLASCIMPTFNRRLFVPRAIHCFLTQDYPHAELIVVDDGTDPIVDLLPDDRRVRYFRLPARQNVGAKRNFACQQARGSFVLHWDDDEWYAPCRISRQLNALRNSAARVSGTSVALFYNETSDRAFRYSYGGHGSGWMGALAYPLSVWKERCFDSVPIAEDVRFISRVPVSLRHDFRDPYLYVASIHGANTSPKITTGAYWRPEPIESIHGVPGFAPIAQFASVHPGCH
jgi:hypothetical protein